MLKKSTLSVIGLVCVTIWTLGLTGCSDSPERTARKQLVEATRQADEFCRAAMAEMANPSFDASAPKVATLLDSARKQLNSAINDNSQFAADLPSEMAMAKASLAEIENVEAQYKSAAARELMAKCDSMMNNIFELLVATQTAASAADVAKQQSSFDRSALATKIEQNSAKITETQTRLKNISAALDEKKVKLGQLTSDMNEKSLKSETLMRQSQKLPAGKSRAPLDEALKLNDEVGKLQKELTKGESSAASLAMLIESLQLKIKSLQEYGKTLEDSKKTMSDLAVAAQAKADLLDRAAADIRKQLADKCSGFSAVQKEFCTNAIACQTGLEKSADLLKRALQSAPEDFRSSMQTRQAALGLAAASMGLDLISYKKQVMTLQESLNKGGMNISISDDLKDIQAPELAKSAAANCETAIASLERTLRTTPSNGKWRVHSALASANVTLCRARLASGDTSLADSALKNAESQLKEARDKSKWLAKPALDAIEAQIKQVK